MTRRHPVLLLLAFLTAALGAGLALAVPAAAHPLGNFTVNRYDGLLVRPAELRVDHIEDHAEIPTAQAEPLIDRNNDRTLSRPELAQWARTTCAKAARDSRATADNRPVSLSVRAASAKTRPGQAGLRTLRLSCRLAGPLHSLAPETRIRFTAAPAPGPGWREITARGDRTTLTAGNVPRNSLSARLTNYPKNRLNAPPARHTAELRARPGGPAAAAAAAPDAAPDATSGPARALPRGTDRLTEAFTGLIGRHRLTPGFALLALLAATALGAAHALAPGHGKTIMAAHAASRGRRSLRDILRLGTTVTITHTLGVLLLGLLVATGSRAAPTAVAWTGILSGVLVLIAGTVLLRRARSGHGHSHGHGRGHSHSHGHPHSRTDANTTSHPNPHKHSHERPHPHERRPHPHEHPHEHEHPHQHPHPDPHHPRTRDTLLMGLAGGMVPSPSAVLVLIGAATLGQLWFGILLVVAYGAGLALALVAIGFLIVGAGARLAAAVSLPPRLHRLRAPLRTLHRIAPTATATMVIVLGAALTLRAALSA